MNGDTVAEEGHRAALTGRCEDEGSCQEGKELAGRDFVVLAHPKSWDFVLQPWEMT